MPYVKMMIHVVWATKRRIPYLQKELRTKVIAHIRENARSKGIKIDRLNGYTDHLHALINLRPDMSVSDAVRLLKGESSHWINKHRLTEQRFAWAEEYYAATVDDSTLPKVRAYIDGQEQHHSRNHFEDELRDFLVESGIEFPEPNAG
jgi:putative transposase